MAKVENYNSDQLFNFSPGSYLERTARPIYGIIFLLPFIIFYELGTIFINTDVLNQSQVRVIAFVWLQSFIEYIGFEKHVAWFVIPLVVVSLLLGMQLASRKHWRIRLKDTLPMAVECLLLAVPLIVLSLLLNRPAVPQSDTVSNVSVVVTEGPEAILSVPVSQTGSLDNARQTAFGDSPSSPSSLLADIVTGIGAGIYEELIFRLILICLLMLFFQNLLGLTYKSSIMLSVLISAALFSVHHHVVFLNSKFSYAAAFTWPEFVFRTIAGIYFACLFAIRGFGITAGTHAFYDIIAALINVIFTTGRI